MKARAITLTATQFKARCLQLLDKVDAHGLEVTITKHGQPVARLVPLAMSPDVLKGRSPAELYSSLAGMATIVGGIESPLDEIWHAER